MAYTITKLCLDCKDIACTPLRELGQLGVVAEQHHPVKLVAELVNDVEQIIRVAAI